MLILECQIGHLSKGIVGSTAQVNIIHWDHVNRTFDGLAVSKISEACLTKHQCFVITFILVLLTFLALRRGQSESLAKLNPIFEPWIQLINFHLVISRSWLWGFVTARLIDCFEDLLQEVACVRHHFWVTHKQMDDESVEHINVKCMSTVGDWDVESINNSDVVNISDFIVGFLAFFSLSSLFWSYNRVEGT